jgi:hypothetical protein
MQKDLIVLSTTHQQTPRTITQSKVVNVLNDNNHELVQLLSEVASIQQPWRSVTPSYNPPKICASTSITTSVGFQNQPSHTKIHLVPTNSEMEQLHLLNRLEQLCHVDRRLCNQSISIPHVKPVEPKVTPIVV